MPNPEVILIDAAEDGSAEAQIYGKRKDNWVRVCLYAGVLSGAFVLGVYLADWLGLLGY